MDNITGILSARLAEAEREYDKRLIDAINAGVRPPHPLKADDVYIRAMYIVSDQINSQGGCFDESELEHLSGLLIDAPVMVGHRRDSLPVARNFLAEKIIQDGQNWVKSWFYWLKDAAGAEDLRRNIDGGIYKECSISFLYRRPECSICGQDIRRCRHVPFEEYPVGEGQSAICHFKYREIERVLETSLVFRGAIPDTHMTDKLGPADEKNQEPLTAGTITGTVLFNGDNQTNQLSLKNRRWGRTIPEFLTSSEMSLRDLSGYSVIPHQPGLNISVISRGNNIELVTTELLPEEMADAIKERLTKIKATDFEVDFLIFARRGKNRLDNLGLMDLLHQNDKYHRLVLRLCDLVSLNGKNLQDRAFPERLKIASQIMPESNNQLEIIRLETPAASVTVEDVAAYKYGLEIIGGDDKNGLKRIVVGNNVRRVMQITACRDIKGGYGKHEMIEPGSDLKIEASFRTHKGIIPGTLVLVEESNRGQKNYKLVDLLPGYEENDFRVSGTNNTAGTISIIIGSMGDKLQLYFEHEGKRTALVVHAFSSALWRRGRRFIADLQDEKTLLARPQQIGVLEAKSVNQQGKLLAIHPRGKHELLGEMRRIWIQPVLIDGCERCLFYGEPANYPPAE